MNRVIDLNDLMALLLTVDVGPAYTIAVYANLLLTTAWLAVIRSDPAHRVMPAWQFWARRVGAGMVMVGLGSTVMFGGALKWVPWPPMLMVALGADLFIAMGLLTALQRCKLHEAWSRAFNQKAIEVAGSAD